MRRRRIRFKRRKRRYRQKGRGVKLLQTVRDCINNLGKENLNISIKYEGCKKFLLKLRKNKS